MQHVQDGERIMNNIDSHIAGVLEEQLAAKALYAKREGQAQTLVEAWGAAEPRRAGHAGAEPGRSAEVVQDHVDVRGRVAHGAECSSAQVMLCMRAVPAASAFARRMGFGAISSVAIR